MNNIILLFIKKILIPLLLLWSLQFFGQEGTDIIIGKHINISSKVLDMEREISVYLPYSYHQNEYKRYPVMYLLDGRKFFNSFSGAISQMASDASPQIPEMILIGISSQDRIKDSSPTNSTIGYTGKEETGLEVSGGADDFLEFLNSELIPFVDGHYRTNTYRSFVGYSFTGLAVVHALFSTPNTFNSYLVIDFSAWWDDEIMLKKLNQFSRSYSGPYRDVYLATVDRVDNTVYPETYNPVWKFIQAFEQHPPKNVGLGYQKYAYKTENHHSMPLRSFMDGLKYLFRGHMINYDEMYNEPHLIAQKFEILSKRLGYEVTLPESLVNYLGSTFRTAHPDMEKALTYFELNTKNYPRSSWAWSTLGEAYEAKGDIAKAQHCYGKALELDPSNGKLKQKLAELKEK